MGLRLSTILDTESSLAVDCIHEIHLYLLVEFRISLHNSVCNFGVCEFDIATQELGRTH